MMGPEVYELLYVLCAAQEQGRCKGRRDPLGESP